MYHTLPLATCHTPPLSFLLHGLHRMASCLVTLPNWRRLPPCWKNESLPAMIRCVSPPSLCVRGYVIYLRRRMGCDLLAGPTSDVSRRPRAISHWSVFNRPCRTCVPIRRTSLVRTYGVKHQFAVCRATSKAPAMDRSQRNKICSTHI